MLFDNLTPAETLALTKLADSDCRDLVDEGTHDVDVVVHVRGQVKVGADHEAVISAAVPWEKVAVLALSKMNDDTRRKVVELALGDEPVGDEIKAEAKAIADEVKGSTRAMRKGSVRPELVVSRARVAIARVEADQAAEDAATA